MSHGADATTPSSESLARALDRTRSRGLDEAGTWQADGAYLAILDLDQHSAQPVHSPCGCYVIVHDGEIYNFALLRAQLQERGVAFRTTLDTEVLLALFAEAGEAMLLKLYGMFAFVIWDKIARRAFAARDPYGIKPLNIAQTREGVLLTSQLKTLLTCGLVDREPSPRDQAGFWLLGSALEPFTWYRHICALPVGQRAWIENSRMAAQAGRMQARRSGNVHRARLADWSRTVAGARWLRRCLHALKDLLALASPEQAEVALRDFDLVNWIESRYGPLPDDLALALGLIESSTYLRNRLLRDSDWASMDHSVELHTPLVDAHLLLELQPWLGAFLKYPGKALPVRAPEKVLPREVGGRRKTWFGIPVANRMGAGRAGAVGAGSSRGWWRKVARAYAGSLHGGSLA